MDALTKKKTDRFLFLNRLYELTGGDKLIYEDMGEIGRQLGLSREEIRNVMNYLDGEGLAMYRGIGGQIAMTHAGVVQVEKALSKPEIQTEYFPPVVNILNIQSMIGSQIQQGTHGSTQSQTISVKDIAAIENLLTQVKSALGSLQMQDEVHREAEAEIQTVEAQLKSSKPKSAIIRESLVTLRALIEGVASNALAAGLLPLFVPVAAALGF